jgi:hypothetical protein
MIAKAKVFQLIKNAKSTLGLSDVTFEVKFAEKSSRIGKRAEIFIWSQHQAEIVFYPEAIESSVSHEVCHLKLYRMGLPITNTETDLELFPDKRDYLRMVLIVEHYITELQQQFFHEPNSDKEEPPSPRSPFQRMPPLPKESFTHKQVSLLINLAKGDQPLQED